MLNPVGNQFNLTVGNDLKIDDDEQNQDSFSSLLTESLDKVNTLQQGADRIREDFALGKVDNVHDVTIAAARASTAMNLTLAVQNKIVDAYKEIMRMQI